MKGPSASITALGALVAVGLVGMKTGNEKVASELLPPPNEFLLDYVKPELLMMQAISRNLILWNEIDPSKNWILDQIPNFIRKAVNQGEKRSSELPSNDHIIHCYFFMLAGLCFSISLKYAGSCNKMAYESICEILDIVIPAATPSGAIKFNL